MNSLEFFTTALFRRTNGISLTGTSQYLFGNVLKLTKGWSAFHIGGWVEKS